MNYKKFFTVILSIFTITVCYGGKVVPEKKNGIVELFNTDRHKAEDLFHRCAPWIKGDLTPVLKDVENKDGKWVKISYTGSKGMGQIIFFTSPGILKKLLDKNSVYEGIRLGVYYTGKDFLKVGISLGFSDKTILATNITLKQGYHEYTVKTGFRRAKFPPKWDLLKIVGIIKRSSKPVKNTFLLNKVVMLTKKVEIQKKEPQDNL